ncbi:hypothetical protein I350_04751 [Cryptococcus amylolentus CBS 6273]|uniref:NmrA-like domain-containing protein n=1 Tax=Cryptococcus amylolentus CBS 6273 TaxID=1296118 RepID=A0A1E3JY00_9TREE|nr:hypothetical protein I350_04751 [Cryptococcus amylolentus CBS 6273]
MSKIIVVFGATGQQGSALINALSEYNTPTPHYTILALSRSPLAPSSVTLGSLPGVKIVPVAKNYMDEPDKVFLDNGLGKGGVWGVFSVQGYVSEDVEWKQAKAIADASKAIEVKHFVYSGVSFGTLVNDPPLAFAVKRKVEQYIESINLPHTFLRPTQFMDNLLPTSPFLFKVSRTILLRRTFYNHPERKHQMVSCRDIGQMGALAFANPHQYLGKAVDLAGDEFTMEELEKRYEGIMGAPIQLTFGVLAGFVRWMVAPLGSMANFYDDYGYTINIPELRKDMPELEDLDAFLKRYKGAIESKE